MLQYALKRLGMGLVAIFVLITVTFFLIRLMPGSPFQTGYIPQQIVDALEEEFGLNESVFIQYLSYIKNLLHGDFGISYQKPGLAVTDVILNAWPVTLSIGVPAMGTALIGGTLLGIHQASTKKAFVRNGIFMGTVLMMAVPNFVIAILLMTVAGQELKWFPVAGLSSPIYYILPVVSLAIYPLAVITRITHNTFSEEINKDYIVLARSKGLPEWRITVNHVLINISVPIMGYIGILATSLLTGSFVIESIFTIPGLGREFVMAVINRDYTMIMGLTVFMGIVVILSYLIADLLCALFSPRIRRNLTVLNGLGTRKVRRNDI